MVVSAQEIEQLVREGIEKSRKRFSNDKLSSTEYAVETGKEDGLVKLALKLEERKGIKIDLNIPYPNSTKSS